MPHISGLTFLLWFFSRFSLINGDVSSDTTNQVPNDTCSADECASPLLGALGTPLSPTNYDILPLFDTVYFSKNGTKFTDDILYNQVNTQYDDCEFIRWRITGKREPKPTPDSTLIGCEYYNKSEGYTGLVKQIAISVNHFPPLYESFEFQGNIDFAKIRNSKLRKLHLYASTTFTFDNIDGFSKLSTLESLRIYYANVGMINFDDISLSNVEEIVCIHCGLSGTLDFRKLLKAPKIQHITIRYNSVTSVKFAKIPSKKSQLMTLSLNNNDIRGKFSLRPFAVSTVRYMNLAANRINSIDLSELKTKSKLHSLVLSNNSFTGTFDLAIVSQNLKVLELENNNIAEIRVAKTFSSLQTLKLNNNPLIKSDDGNHGIQEFFEKLLSRNPTLIEIEVRNCRVHSGEVLIKDIEPFLNKLQSGYAARKVTNTTIFVNGGHCIMWKDGSSECVTQNAQQS